MNYPKNRKSRSTPSPYSNKEWLYEEYVVKDKSTKDIAEECGCQQSTVQQYLSKFKIKKEKVARSRDYKNCYQQYEYLYREHIVNRKSMTQIAKENGVSADTIRENLLRLGIEIWHSKQKIKLEPHKEEIIRLYCEEHKSANQISEIYNCSHRAVVRLLRAAGIRTRTIQEAQYNYLSKEIPSELEDAKWLQREHWDNNKSCAEIGKELGVGPGTVRRQMKKFGIKSKNNSESKIGLMKGEKHPNWKGGLTDLKALLREYFTVNLAPVAVKRDSCRCQFCGKNHTVLHVHHIIPFKEIVEGIVREHPEYDCNIPEDRLKLYDIIVKDSRFLDLNNLITLCAHCHRNVAHKKTTSSQASQEEGSTTIESTSNERVNE